MGLDPTQRSASIRTQQQLAMDWTVRGSDLSFPSPILTSPDFHPASYRMDTRSLSRG